MFILGGRFVEVEADWVRDLQSFLVKRKHKLFDIFIVILNSLRWLEKEFHSSRTFRASF